MEHTFSLSKSNIPLDLCILIPEDILSDFWYYQESSSHHWKTLDCDWGWVPAEENANQIVHKQPQWDWSRNLEYQEQDEVNT